MRPEPVCLGISCYSRVDADDEKGLDVYKHQEHTAPPPGWNDAAQGGKEQPTVWNYYSKKGDHYDGDLIGDANNTVDVLLIFVSLRIVYKIG